MDREIALEPNWILWPPTPESTPANASETPNRDLVRLLSLTTGADWNLRATGFRAIPRDGGFLLLDRAELAARGLFAARARLLAGRRLVPLARPGGALPLEAIALCATGDDPVRPATDADLRSARTLLVALAPDGDAVVRARRAIAGSELWNAARPAAGGGRILLVESPPPAGSRWSRFWTLGRGWPATGVSPVAGGVPGLLPARDAARLLTRPETFAWTPSERLLRREPDRWLAPAASALPILLVVLASLLASAWGLFEVARDRRDPRADLAARAAFALPAAILASPLLSASFGPGFWPLAAALLLAGALGVGALARRWWGRSAELGLVALLGLLATLFAGPFHPWSGVLRDLPGGVSPEALGAAALYAAVAGGATRRGEGLLWFAVRLGAVAAIALALRTRPETAVAPLLGLLAGEGLLTPVALPAAALLPPGLVRLSRAGVDWRPDGLVREWPAPPDVNLWSHAALLLSPPAVLFALACALGAMTLAPYAGFRLRRALAFPGSLRPNPGLAGLSAAAFLAAAGLLTPEWLSGALLAAAGALPLLLADARGAS